MRAFALLLLVTAAPVLAQPVYRWTDRAGQVHYTNDPAALPADARVETTDGEALTEVGASAATAPRPKPAAATLPAPIREGGRARARRPGPVEVKLTKVEVAVSDADREYIEAAIRAGAASPRLAEWGGLLEAVDVEIAAKARMKGCDGDGAFGLAVGPNLVLLRAPADTVSWGQALDYEMTVVHELAHTLEHQVAGGGRPRWFAEGFAMFVSDASGFASLEDVAWWVLHEGGARPLDAMFDGSRHCKVHLAYAIARQAVSFLVQLVGQAGVQRMFALRAQGAGFEPAFAKVAGFPLAEFQKRFAESLRPHDFERAN